MRCLIIPDSFKEGLDGIVVANAIESGIKKASSSIEVTKMPVCDGGDGLTKRIIDYTSGKLISVTASDPLGKPILTNYGVIDNSDVAIIESALTCGISLLSPEERDPAKTTSFGLGEVIKKVVGDGYKKIIIGLGGSATNDGGVGMLQSLGVKFYDCNGDEIAKGGAALANIDKINIEALSEYANIEFEVACNPSSILCGPRSTSLIYSEQKGATPEQSHQLDKALFHYGIKTLEQVGTDVRYVPGSGGAGGIGAAFKGYLGAELQHSIEIIKRYVPISQRISEADFVISAEGRFDERSLKGKIVGELAKISKLYEKPFYVLCGQMPVDTSFSNDLVKGVFCISHGPNSLGEAINMTYNDLERTAFNLVRLIQ